MREFYTKEWFPYCMAMGITWEQFWEMNPRIVNAHIKGHKIYVQEINALYHLEGAYTREALMATVGNMFKKKGAKPYEYPDKPFDLDGHTQDQEMLESGEMTEEEKIKQTRLLFARLESMKMNYDLAHGKKQDNGDDV